MKKVEGKLKKGMKISWQDPFLKWQTGVVVLPRTSLMDWAVVRCEDGDTRVIEPEYPNKAGLLVYELEPGDPCIAEQIYLNDF